MEYIFLIKCFKNTCKIVDTCNIIIKDFKDIFFIGQYSPYDIDRILFWNRITLRLP